MKIHRCFMDILYEQYFKYIDNFRSTAEAYLSNATIHVCCQIR
jgi:hypothetical protein